MRIVGIDPATNTGFVALDLDGNVLESIVIKGDGPTIKGGLDTKRLVSLENKLYNALRDTDFVAIEESSKGTQRAVTTGMVHGGLRTTIYRKGIRKVYEVNPSRTKKFVNAGGKVPVAEKKPLMRKMCHLHFGFDHANDNIVDAYVIARIGLSIYRRLNGIKDDIEYKYMLEVIDAILS